MAAAEASQLASRQLKKRSKRRRHEMKHLSDDAAIVDDFVNQGMSDQLCAGAGKRKSVDHLENENAQSSFSMQSILGSFLATKLQVIEHENQTVSRSTTSNKRQKDKSRKSSSKTSRKRSSDFSDLRPNDELTYDKNANNCLSDSKNPKDFWNYSERPSSCAMLERTCMKAVHQDHSRSHRGHENVLHERDDKISGEKVHFRSSALKHRSGLERSYSSGAFPFEEVSLEHVPSSYKEEDGYEVRGGESCYNFPLEISQEQISDFKEDNHVRFENHTHKSKRKHSSSRKSKEASEGRHKKSKMRTRKDSVEVSTFTNPYFQTSSSNAKATLRCSLDSLYDDVECITSESDEKTFGFSSERYSTSCQKSCDFFQPSSALHKPENQMSSNRKRNSDCRVYVGDDIGDETWVERYNRSKSFKRRRSHSGSVPAEADIGSLQYNKYSQLSTANTNWGQSSKHNRLFDEGQIYKTCIDESDPFSYSRSKTHSRTKSSTASLKKKSSREVKHVSKHEKKKHKNRDKSLAKSSHGRKSAKHKRRKSKNENKIPAESNAVVEIAKSCVLPSDDDDNFRPMPIAVENNDDISELWLGKRATLTDDSSEQLSKQQLDYSAVVACAEKISVPSRIVKTYKEGVAVSRLLRRVKTRIGPLKPVEISRLQATLPRHPVMTVDECSRKKSADQVSNSVVVQDVEDPAVGKQEQPQTCESLPTISDVSAEHTSDDILQTLPLGILGEPAVVQAGPVNYLDLAADRSDSSHQDQLSGVTSQETVLVNLLPEYSQVSKHDVQAGTSVDPATTLEIVAAAVEPCLSLSVVSEVTVETSDSESYANDQEKSVLEVASESLVQTIIVESSENVTLHRANQFLENSCIQHSCEHDDCAVTDEVQDNFSGHRDILPELACGSCSDGSTSSQNIGNEATTIISPNEDRSLEDVAIADTSVSNGTTFDETTDCLADIGQQDEVSISRQNRKQCLTLVESSIVGIGMELTGIEENEKEVPEKDVTTKETSENEASMKEVHGTEVIEKAVTGKEVCENEAGGDKIDDVEVERHCTEEEVSLQNEEAVNKASSSQGMLCTVSEMGSSKEIISCGDPSLSAEQEGRMQTLETNSFSYFVRPGSDIPCYKVPFLESTENQACKEDGKKAVKKLARPMGIKISGWSAAFISSGTLYENDPKKRNREEGEITDSSAYSSESENFEPAPVECALNLESSGSLSEYVQEGIEETVVRHKSKQHKKHKRKHKKHKKQKRRRSIEPSSDEEQSRSRSRSRSFSIARTFDEAKGVWREKKHKNKRKKVQGKNRPRLNIDKEKLREIAIKNSLHNQMKLNRPMMKLNELSGTRPGGKSVAELTDFCKTISGKMDYSTSSSEDENGLDARQRAIDSLEDESETFLTNFMKGRDKDARIVLNIRDSRQLPALSAQEMMAKKAVMRLMFPVSNGAQHRHKEEGWVPVTKPDPEKPLSRPRVPINDPSLQTVTIPAVPPTSAGAAAVELATARAPVLENPLPLLPLNSDVNVIITERLAAIRRLNANPTDAQALEDVVRAQMQMQQWAEEKKIPGQFFTSVLRRGLMGDKLKKHDWLRKAKQNAESGLVLPDATTAVLQSDLPGDNGVANNDSTVNPLAATGPDRTYNIGKLMMLRMGWKESEGLGRQNLGRLTPLSLAVKNDRKGLQAPEEKTRPLAQVLSVKGKHPVSALMEICVKRRIGQPEFVLAEETGPSHYKRFLYKVILNGVEYQPNVGSQNKKSARLQAAACCLDALGLSEAVNN